KNAHLTPKSGSPSLQAHERWQSSDILDLVIRVRRGWRRLVATCHERLVANTHIIGRHQIITRAVGYVQDVFRPTTQVIQHVFESLQAWLVGASLLRRENLMERCAELGHVL